MTVGTDKPAGPVGRSISRLQRATSDNHLDEVAEILAAGLQRRRAREKARKSAESGAFSLDFTADQSVHEPQVDRHKEWV